MEAMLTVGATLVGFAVMMVVGGWGIRRWAENRFRVVVAPGEGGAPSPLALAIDAVAKRFALAMVATLKGTAMGVESGASRREKGEAATQLDLALEGLPVPKGLKPLAGLLLSIFKPGGRGGDGELGDSSGSSTFSKNLGRWK